MSQPFDKPLIPSEQFGDVWFHFFPFVFKHVNVACNKCGCNPKNPKFKGLVYHVDMDGKEHQATFCPDCYDLMSNAGVESFAEWFKDKD